MGAGEGIVRGERAARVDRHLTLAADSGFAGAVLVAVDGEIVLHRGYGWADRRRTVPVTAETPFWVASISKQFTAAAILRLAEQGRLSLGDSIGAHLDGVPEEKRGITLHQLLTHTAGLAQEYAADGVTRRDDALRALLAAPLAHPPGTRFGYTNDAYNLLAMVVETASGEPFEAYLRRSLFAPAAMERTGFWGNPASVAPIHGALPARNRAANWGFRGATGISSTAGDLHRWHQALEGGAVLSEASRRALQSPHVAVGTAAHHGYGWFISRTPRGTPSVWTRGTEDFGHNAVLASHPAERLVVVALSNAGERGGIPVTRRVAERVAELMLAPPQEADADAVAHPGGPAPLTAEGWGPLRIGMTRAEVVAAAGEDADPEAVGGPEPEACDELRPREAPAGMRVMLEQGRLTRISVARNAEVRTPEGFGVGSPAAEIRAAYGARAEATPHKYLDAPAEYLTVWTVAAEGPAARGIVYEIGTDGRAAQVHAGSSSIRYVEGCL